MSHFEYDPNEANPLLDPGRYDAVVMAADARKTKAGDPMLVLQVKVYDPNGVKPTVFDNITRPYGVRRLKQLCEATGVPFDDGNIEAEDLRGHNIIVELRVKTDPNGVYEDSNAVTRYLPDDGPKPGQPQSPDTSPRTESLLEKDKDTDGEAGTMGF